MEIKSAHYVTVSGRELFKMYSEIDSATVKDFLSIHIPVDETKMSLNKIEQHWYLEILFVFYLTIKDGIKQTTTIMLVVPEQHMLEKITEKALKEKGIKKAVNLNTPRTDVTFTEGEFKNDEKKILVSFNFSTHYDSSDDYQ